MRGVSDAVGAAEQWEPVFQDGKMALLGAHRKFVGLDGDSETVICVSGAGKNKMITIRWGGNWKALALTILHAVKMSHSLTRSDVLSGFVFDLSQLCSLSTLMGKLICRSNAEREEDQKEEVPEEEQGNVGQIELNYVKKFQKFKDHKIRLNQTDRRDLLRAKAEGDLHEALLDRRAKMKADRYCK